MKSIGVLQGMRKEKRAAGAMRECRFPLRLLLLIAVASAFLQASSLAAFAQGNDVNLSTRSGEAVITKDPATGDRVMQTPEAKPQEEYKGPQTIIVAPEVYPGGRPGPGGNPGSGGHRSPPRPR